MNGFFSSENGLFQLTGVILDIFILSIFWLVASLPVVTVGPASIALYYTCAKCIRCHEPEPYRNFWSAFRQNLRTGVATSLVFLIVLALLGFGAAYLYAVASAIGGPWQLALGVYLLLALLPLSMTLCAWALLSRFQYTVGGLLADAFRVTLQNLPRLMPLALITALLALLAVLYWRYPLLLLFPALDALLATVLLEPMLRKYTPDYDPNDPRAPEDRPWYLR